MKNNDLISRAAAIKAVHEVKHGYWIQRKYGVLECSECGDTAPFEVNEYGKVMCVTKFPYCPFCGSKNTKEDNDDETD